MPKQDAKRETPTVTLTDRAIAALKAPKNKDREEYTVEGLPSLRVRVSKSGSKSFSYIYHFKLGHNEYQQKRLTLGQYGTNVQAGQLSCAMARAKHAAAVEAHERGDDPATVKVEENRAERDAETVNDLVAAFTKQHVDARLSPGDPESPYVLSHHTRTSYGHILRREIEPIWRGRKVKDIHRRDIIKLLDDIAARPAPAMRNYTATVIKVMLNFAVDKEMIEISPAQRIKKLPAPPKERALSDDEIKSFWNGLPGTTISKAGQLALKFILVSGQRPDECASAKWSEIDREAKVWKLSKKRTKSKRDHLVPLSDLALSVLEEAERLADGSVFVFPSPQRPKEKAIDRNSLSECLLHHRAALGLEGATDDDGDPLPTVTPHVLRKSTATLITRLGFPQFIASRVLNHSSEGVTGKHYNFYDYLREKRQALDAVAARIVELTTGAPRKAPPLRVVEAAA